MSDIFKRSLGFYIPFLIFVVLGGLHLLFQYTHGYWVMWFCENFNQQRYDLFSWFTLLGEPQVVVPIALLLFLLNFGKGVFVFSTWLVASLITIILKGIIANHRPAFYFKDLIVSCAGEIELWFNLSTPSGHTTAAFAFFASLAILSKKTYLQFIFFIIALLAGLSRMVLFMHFFYDVYLGAIIGSVSAAFMLYSLQSYQKFGYMKWKDKSLMDFTK
jgi:membrane-associated phospholipid phosphatase